MIEISRKAYCDMYGPTVGDRVRLGDTSLIAEVEKDLTVHGDEAKFGGGKSLRDGMGQSCKATDKECLDTVITNALIIDSTGIIKADVGIKNGRIAGIGKAGNPDIMNGVDKNMIIGASTEAIAGEGLILTAGGLDTHIHFISPTQLQSVPKYNGETGEPILYVEFQTPLGRLYPDDSDAKKELQTIIEQKLGKSIELHMLVAEDHQQTNLTQITVDQAIRENIHMDVVIEETPGSEPEE